MRLSPRLARRFASLVTFMAGAGRGCRTPAGGRFIAGQVAVGGPADGTRAADGRFRTSNASPDREKRPTSRTPVPGALRSTACVSRPATVQASGAPVGAGGGRQTPAAIGTPPVPTPAALPRAATQVAATPLIATLAAATPAAATPAGGAQPAVMPTAAEQAVRVLARRSRERARPQRSPAPGRPAAEQAYQPDHHCSRLATTAAGRAATLPGAGPGVPHRGMDQALAAPSAKDRSAATRQRPASRRRCTRLASSRPGTLARTAGQGRDPSQRRRTGASRTAGSPAGHRVTSASLTKLGSRQHSRARLAHGITTVPAPNLAIQYWQSATRLQMSPRRRPGMPWLTAGRPGPGQLRPCLTVSLAARERHLGGTAPRPASRGRS